MQLTPHCYFPNKIHGNRGFTLIELSIVLVIIGLIVGGILVGRDMIKTAALQSQIAQIDKYKAAANAFKLKYSGLPGDIPLPSLYGLYQPSGTGGLGLGNNDGLITSQGRNGSDCGVRFSGEITLFWYHLSQAGLIDGAYSAGILEYTSGTATVGNAFPRAKINDAAGIVALGLPATYCGTGTGTNTLPASRNFFYIGASDAGSNSLDARYGGFWANDAAVSPSDSLYMDTKIDDGQPLSGTLQARFSYGTANILPYSDNQYSVGCTNASSIYNLSTTKRACWLRFDAGF